MNETIGFPASRKGKSRMDARRRWRQSSAWLWQLALAALLWTLGATRVWSQNSGSLSSSSSSDLQTWEQLSMRFTQGLDGQSMRLQQALTELETSKASSQKSISLLEELLQANSDLRSYNIQIASRMQERDEDLVDAYDTINRLEKQVLRLIIALISVCAVLAAIVILIILRR